MLPRLKGMVYIIPLSRNGNDSQKSWKNDSII
jgi:hypothetical protein